MIEHDPSILQMILQSLNDLKQDCKDLRTEIKEQTTKYEKYVNGKINENMKQCRAKEIFDNAKNEEGFFAARNYVANRKGLLQYVIACLLSAGWMYVVLKDFIVNLFKQNHP